MASLGLVVGFFGYAVVYYGLTQVRAGHGAPLPAVGFLTVLWPGHWQPKKAA